MSFNLRNCMSLVVLHLPFFLGLFFLCAVLIVHILAKISEAASAGHIVTTLPGFPTTLPFALQTGYVSVEESELFYYFVKSQNKPKADPLLLYINGGPGCSALNGLFYQIGPLEFNLTDYEGGLPSLLSVSYSWSKSANILFLDAPIGTGFSYSNSSTAYNVSDTESAAQTFEFLRKWLSNHTDYITNPLFVGGDRYSGLIVPIIVQNIIAGNEDGLKPHMNIKGYVISSPHEDRALEMNSRIPYARQMGLIPDALYESAKESCNGSYVDVDSSETKCLEDLDDISECISEINQENILLPICDISSPNLVKNLHKYYENRVIRSVTDQKRRTGSSSPHFQSRPLSDDDYQCPTFKYLLSEIWANYPSVRDALDIQEGTIDEWYRCNTSLLYDSYTFDVETSFEYHKNLTQYRLQVLVLSGDHDMVTPHISTEEWINDLNLTEVSKWRPWQVNGEVAGYTVTYGTHYGYTLTYATVKGAGHSPQEYYRRKCYEMFQRWIHHYPL